MAGLKNQRILISGATGFIGSHIAERLANTGFDVIATDIQINPRSYFIVEGVYKKVPFNFMDVRDKEAIREAIIKNSPDYILHLAAQTLVTTAYDNPYETLETNIMGTVNILEEARKTGNIKGIIVASSDKAYGKTTKSYIESQPLQGDHPYDVSKSSADLICSTYFKTYNLPIVVTRFGNVFGEGDANMDRLIPGICEAILHNKKFVIRSDGKYIRDYLYVDDVVSGYMTLLNNFDKIKGEAFNFSSEDKLSVLSLISKAENLYGKKIPYIITNKAKNEIPYQHLNDEKIRKLGWVNNSSFESKFINVLNWYRKIIV